MDQILIKYAAYKNIIITPSNKPALMAFLTRAISVLESKLGYPLDPAKYPPVNILGVSKKGCSCDIKTINPADLEPAPTIKGAVRLSTFDKRLLNQRLNAFSTINAVYAAKAMEDGSGYVILSQITDYQPVIRANGYGNFIKGCEKNPCATQCSEKCSDCLTLITDGEWLTVDNLPDELIFLMFDFMDWMEAGGYSIGTYSSESVDGHSISYWGWDKQGGKVTPYDREDGVAIISNYIGTFGNTSRFYIH